METSLSLLRVPGELEYLVNERQTASPGRGLAKASPLSGKYRAAQTLTPTALRRISSLAVAKPTQDDVSIAYPAWLDGQPIPRLIVTAEYRGLDAFGSSRLLADLDLAVRRAGTMQKEILRSGGATNWPEPLRTHLGGLRLLDARVGSFDVLLTVWGSLVAIAGSSPISVAGLIALAWDAWRGTSRMAKRWVGSVLATGQQGQPSLVAPDSAVPWGIQHTKALAPVLRDAIANDQGFEFFLDESDRRIKLTVPPKARD